MFIPRNDHGRIGAAISYSDFFLSSGILRANRDPDALITSTHAPGPGSNPKKRQLLQNLQQSKIEIVSDHNIILIHKNCDAFIFQNEKLSVNCRKYQTSTSHLMGTMLMWDFRNRIKFELSLGKFKTILARIRSRNYLHFFH